MKTQEAIALGYIIGALWTFFGAMIFVMWRVWVYERRMREMYERRTKDVSDD